MKARESDLYRWQGKGKKIVIYADTPTCLYSSWDKLIIIIFNHSYTRLLWDYVNGTNPWAVSDRKDDTIVHAFQNIFPNHFLQHWV